MEICSSYYLDEIIARIGYFKVVRGAIWHDDNLCRMVCFKTLGIEAQRAFKTENREHFEHGHKITPELQRLKQDLKDLADSIKQRFKDEELNIVEVMQKYPLQRGLAGAFYEWVRLIEDYYPEPQQEQAAPEPQREKPKSTRGKGRPKGSFKDRLVDDADGKKLERLHQVMKGKMGKDAALTMTAAMGRGWINKPTYQEVKDEFGDIGSKQGFSNYFGKMERYTKEEFEGAKNSL